LLGLILYNLPKSAKKQTRDKWADSPKSAKQQKKE
jgi:hypothetical protein